MRTVDLVILGQKFSLACDEGQEARLLQLADEVNTRAESIATSQPKAKESHLFLMTCLMLADELYDARMEAGVLHEKLANNINILPEDSREALQEMLPGYVTGALSDALEEISMRIDQLSRSVESARESVV